MRSVVPWLVVFACKGESTTKPIVAEETPTESPVGPAPVIDATAAVAADAQPPRGSLDERRALAKKLDSKGFTVRTSGANDTVLEITSKVEGCKLKNLIPVVNTSGQTMVNAGFTQIRCIGNGDFVDLLDANGEQNAAVGLTSERLSADYEENELAADQKYRGKALRVTGKIESVGKVLDEPIVVLVGGLGVHAAFKEEAPLLSLKKGQPITVRCVGAGMPVAIRLEDCQVETASP
jgi:hypothetical protein